MGHYQGQVTVTRDSYVHKIQVVHIEKYMQIKFRILKVWSTWTYEFVLWNQTFFQTSTKTSSI